MDSDDQDFYKPTGGATATVEPPPVASASGPVYSPPPDKGSITWSGSEYIHHHKGLSWFALLAGASVILAGATYFLTKDYFATGTIVVLGVIVGAYGARKPKDITYELSNRGLKVGQKQYYFGQFKSFSIIRGTHGSSISLLPLKKFMPPVDADFGPADEEKITDILGQYLPYEERKEAGIDRLSSKLKF